MLVVRVRFQKISTNRTPFCSGKPRFVTVHSPTVVIANEGCEWGIVKVQTSFLTAGLWYHACAWCVLDAASHEVLVRDIKGLSSWVVCVGSVCSIVSYQSMHLVYYFIYYN